MDERQDGHTANLELGRDLPLKTQPTHDDYADLMDFTGAWIHLYGMAYLVVEGGGSLLLH